MLSNVSMCFAGRQSRARRPLFACLALVLTTSVFFVPARSVSAQPRPNVILCMADDQGWGDVGYNGHPILKTPNLDAMSKSGLRFDRFYAAAPVCSPTRGSCITGRHPFRYGIFFANTGHMRKQEVTLAEALKTKGYATGHFGKWHLGTLTTKIKDANRGRPGDTKNYSPPWENGFDTCFSTESKVPTWDPMLIRVKQQGKKWWNPIRAGDVTREYGTYYWVGEETRVDPETLRGCDSKLIMDRALAFIEQSVKSEKPFFTVIWFHAPHWPVVAGDKYRRLYADQSEFAQNHLGCITALDEQMGRLRKQLRVLGVADNTMLWYCADNGPEGPKQGDDGGIGSAGILRGRKRSLYEGGVRVPGLLEWPAKIKRPRTVAVPCCTSDYFPTVLDALGFTMRGQPEPIDGISLIPLIEGTITARPQPIGFQSRNQLSLTDNRYKLYSGNKGKTWELYDLIEDPSESNDLSAAKPQIVDRMKQTLTRWVTSCKASESGADY